MRIITAFTDIRELDVHQWAPFLDSAKLFRFTGYDLKQLFNLYRENLYVSGKTFYSIIC